MDTLAKIVVSLIPVGVLLMFVAGVIQACGRHDIADYFGYTGLGLCGIAIAGCLFGILIAIWQH